jgi:hypothetical protein
VFASAPENAEHEYQPQNQPSRDGAQNDKSDVAMPIFVFAFWKADRARRLA